MYMNTHKIVLIGDSGVGKSSMVTWLLYRRAEEPNSATIGAAFYSKEFNMGNKKIKFNIWDTAGQERFRSIAKLYYRNAEGCFAIFDITNHDSFLNLSSWIEDYQKENDIMNLIIIANKTDLDTQKWQVKESEISQLAKEYKCDYLLTSCINGKNINEAFYRMGKMVMEKENDKDTTKEYKMPILEYQAPHRETDCIPCLK